MISKKVIASIEQLPDEISTYLEKNYNFIDLSGKFNNYKTIKNYTEDKRDKWNEILNSIKIKEKLDILIFRTYTIIDRQLIDILTPNLLYLRAGSGYDNIDIRYALSKSCMVENTPKANTNSAYEHTISLIFAGLKKLIQFDNFTKKGLWRNNLPLNHELYGKSICIIGYGNIGSKVASFAKFMGMKLYIFDPIKNLAGFYEDLPLFSPEEKDDIEQEKYNEKNDFNINYEYLYQILKEVDIVSVHIPLWDKTFKMIDKRFLSSMKENSILINTSRGELFDKEAILSHYKNNTESVLATDVLPEEPCEKEEELFNLPNIIVTPHIGAYTYEARERLKEEVIKCIDIYLNEKKLLYPVNPLFYFSPYFKY